MYKCGLGVSRIVEMSWIEDHSKTKLFIKVLDMHVTNLVF